MTERLFESWRVSHSQLAQYLRAYSEIALSVRALALPTAQHEQICDLTVKYRLFGIPLYRAAALATVFVLEGQRRDLKRRRAIGIDYTEPDMDAESENIRARLAEYSLGRSLKKREVLDGVAEIVSPLLPQFRYFRSSEEFRYPFANGTAFIALESVRGAFNSFAFGVRHRQVEGMRFRLFDIDWKSPKSLPTTILHGSKYHGVDWPISGSQGLALAAEGMKAFVNDVILLYLRTHEDPNAIRETILHDPAHGHVDGYWPPHVAVFAIDALLGQRGWLDDDFDHYRRYYRPGPYLDALGPHYETAKRNWDAVSPSGT